MSRLRPDEPAVAEALLSDPGFEIEPDWSQAEVRGHFAAAGDVFDLHEPSEVPTWSRGSAVVAFAEIVKRFSLIRAHPYHEVDFARYVNLGHHPPSTLGTSSPLHREVLRLRSRVDELEERLELISSRLDDVDIETADPFSDWCERHERELAEHRDQFIGVSLERGIVVADADHDAFQAKLRALDPGVRAGLYVVHTATLMP